VLSQKKHQTTNECFICDGHKYTIIFFKQGLLTQYNKDIYEVKDQRILSRLHNEYKANYAHQQVYTPIISGSVVDGGSSYYPFTRMCFERKLRMMRVELFATLLIS